MLTKEQSNFIKLIAIATMLIDHIGGYLFPLEILRIIGRISFPIFAYQIGVGYEMTSSKKNYIKRLAIFGVISQIPYYLLTESFILNILFTFILGIFAIWSVEKRKYFFFLLIIPISFFVDFQIYGLAIILIFYFFKNKIHQSCLFFLANVLHSLYYNIPTQIFSLLSLPIIFNPFLKIKLPRNFFYFFYPAHLVVIYLIKVIFL